FIEDAQDAHNLAIDDRTHAAATFENYRQDLLSSLNTFGRHASNFAEAQQSDLAAVLHLYAQHTDDTASHDPSPSRDYPPEQPRIAPSFAEPPAMILDTNTHGRDTPDEAAPLAAQGSSQITEPPQYMMKAPIVSSPSEPLVSTNQGSPHNTPHVLAQAPNDPISVPPSPHESPCGETNQSTFRVYIA
ncbi:hypothetical protein OY671_004648, partial [Metschnikowia pulcherrima]